MHFTELVYHNPCWPAWPLLEVTRGCAHNRFKFRTMYKGATLVVAPLEHQIEHGDLDRMARVRAPKRSLE